MNNKNAWLKGNTANVLGLKLRVAILFQFLRLTWCKSCCIWRYPLYLHSSYNHLQGIHSILLILLSLQNMWHDSIAKPLSQCYVPEECSKDEMMCILYVSYAKHHESCCSCQPAVPLHQSYLLQCTLQTFSPKHTKQRRYLVASPRSKVFLKTELAVR